MRIFSACLRIFSYWNLVLFLFLNLIFPSGVFAHKSSDYTLPQVSEGQINEALFKTVPLRFLPSHPLYFLITTKEFFSRLMKPSAVERAQFDLVLSGKRLKEAYLLLDKNDVGRSSKSLDRYSLKIKQMVEQFEKARSQNQDVGNFIGVAAGDLEQHERLFFAIDKKWEFKEDSYDFDFKFQEAIEGFGQAVMALDRARPGLKDRYKTVVAKNEFIAPYPSPFSEELINEASPSVRPKRIIP